LRTNHAITLTGQGDVPFKGSLAATISLVLNGQAQLNNARLIETIPLTLTSATTQKFTMHVAATIPLPTISAQEFNTPPNENTLPALTISSSLLTGTIANVAATMPMLTIEVDLGHDTAATLPALTIDSALLPGALFNGAGVLPALTSTAQLDSQVTITSANTLPLFTLAARLDISGEILSSSFLPALQLESVSFVGSNLNAALTFPAFTNIGFLAENGIGTVTQILPSLYSNGLLHNGQTAVFNPFTMNTENYYVTQYTNYDFHSVFEVSGKYYGVNSAGIFELTGSKDDGIDIAANFKLGFSDLKKAGMKRVPYVYLGYTSDGAMNIDVSIDGEPVARQYTVGNISNTSGIKRGRAKVARGLKSRYWQFGASNIAGSDFEIEELGFYIQQFDRKAQ